MEVHNLLFSYKQIEQSHVIKHLTFNFIPAYRKTMSNQYYQLVQNVEDIKRVCSSLNIVNYALDDQSVNSQVIFTQDPQIVINDSNGVPVIYQQQPQQQTNQLAQSTSNQFIIQDDEIQHDTNFVAQTSQVNKLLL